MTAQSPFRIMFACVGNSARSQMAEGFCRALASDGVVCKSGGSHPSGKLQRASVEAMAELGIDISNHTSKAIDEEFSAAADLIVVMGCGDDACPAFIGKPIEDWDLADPKGAPLSEVRRVRDDIERRVLALLSGRGLLRAEAGTRSATRDA